MKKQLRSAALFISIIFCFSCGGGGSDANTIGPDGGTITSNDLKFVLTIPAGALTTSTTITATAVEAGLLPTLLQGFADLGSGYQLLPSGLVFLTPATGLLGLLQEDVAAFLDKGALISSMLATEDGTNILFLNNLWIAVDQDTGDYTLTGDIEHFSFISRANGLVSIMVKPAGIIGQVGSTSQVTVTLAGRKNFNFGSYGHVDEVTIKDATLKTLPPDFASVDPLMVLLYYPDGGTPTVSQTFTVTCNSVGDEYMSFYLEAPQTYFLAGGVEYANNSQFGITIPVICQDAVQIDEESLTSFSVIAVKPSAAVGDRTKYDAGAYFSSKPEGSVVLTATVADTSVAGPSPQTVDPYTIRSYTTNKQLLEFECYKAGVTSVAYALTATNVPYYPAPDYAKTLKDLSFNLQRSLTCTETVPAPSGVTVDDTVSCQLTVGWAYTDSFNPDGFSIERVKTPATDWAEIATVAGSARSYVNAKATDPTLELGATYCYRIRAYKDYSGIGRVYSEYSADVGCGTKG